MASKFQFITELYSRTLTRLTGDYESWTGFLRSACYNYKCPFDEQVLIYAQRPDATAVLELEKWNRQFGRWVNAGATGIAVMDEAHGKGWLKHYFDITDTHATRISNSMVELYTIQRYLQMGALQEQGFQHFDAWAANYGETVTAIELAPEGYTLIGR